MYSLCTKAIRNKNNQSGRTVRKYSSAINDRSNAMCLIISFGLHLRVRLDCGDSRLIRSDRCRLCPLPPTPTGSHVIGRGSPEVPVSAAASHGEHQLYQAFGDSAAANTGTLLCATSVSTSNTNTASSGQSTRSARPLAAS